MSIFAAAPIAALCMGIALECGKLVTVSWLYRNWKHSEWILKFPLIVFTIILMSATSMGVFGFLSRAHLEQGASTIDNSAKVLRIDQQIDREKSIIEDNEKVIVQLDNTINSYLGKDRTDKSVYIRKQQAPQRKELRDNIDASQKKIDTLSDEKLKLQSEVRKVQLEVGPIRYIAELFYGTDNSDKNIEAAVRLFILLIVLTFDPLATTLLIAANHTLSRLKNEKEEYKTNTDEIEKTQSDDITTPIKEDDTDMAEYITTTTHTFDNKNIPEILQETEIYDSVPEQVVEVILNSDNKTNDKILESEVSVNSWPIIEINESINYPELEENIAYQDDTDNVKVAAEDNLEMNSLDVVDDSKIVEHSIEMPPMQISKSHINDSLIREIMGKTPHFIPINIKKENNIKTDYPLDEEDESNTNSGKRKSLQEFFDEIEPVLLHSYPDIFSKEHFHKKYNGENDNLNTNDNPKSNSWIKEFNKNNVGG